MSRVDDYEITQKREPLSAPYNPALSLTLVLHSWLRWAIIILGIIAVVRAIGGRGGRPWTQADSTIVKWLSITLDIQFVLGILLYVWLSPITQRGVRGFRRRDA